MLQQGLHNKLNNAMNPNGGIDINIQDQTTPPIIFKLNQIVGTTTLSSETAINDIIISVTSSTGMIIGQYISIVSTTTNRFYAGKIIAINVNDITLDTPLDSIMPIGTDLAFRTASLNVNGSVTPQIFSVRGGTTDIPVEIDITRIILTMTCDTVVTFAKFGDLLALVNGIVLRSNTEIYYNIFNVKSNGEMAGIMYDLSIYSATNPQQAVDGLNARLTFGGQSKMGIVLRIGPGEDLEMIVQDDLTGLLKFEVNIEGHIVD